MRNITDDTRVYKSFEWGDRLDRYYMPESIWHKSNPWGFHVKMYRKNVQKTDLHNSFHFEYIGAIIDYPLISGPDGPTWLKENGPWIIKLGDFGRDGIKITEIFNYNRRSLIEY